MRRLPLILAALLAACAARPGIDDTDVSTDTSTNTDTSTTDAGSSSSTTTTGPPAGTDDGPWDEPPPHEEPHGLTWVVRNSEPALEVVLVGTDATSDPYIGDTICEEQLPILCIDNVPPAELPEGLVVEFDAGWSGGTVRLSEPVAGLELSSQEVADELCAVFGPDYEMAQFHHLTDDGGWNWWAYADLDELTPEAGRFWVRIEDQPGNCWDYP